MLKYLLASLLLCLTLFQSNQLMASNINIDGNFNHKKHINFLFKKSTLPSKSVIKSNHLEWQKSQSDILNLGLQSTPVWIKFKLTNSTNEAKKLFIVLSNPLIDELSLYQLNANEIIKQQTIGDTQPLSARAIKDESLLFSISLKANSQNTILLKAKSEGVLKLPVSIWTPERYVQFKSKFNLLTGILLGFLLALILSNLLIFLLTRHGLFIMSSLYISCLWAVLTGLFGLSYRYFHLDTFWLQQINISTLLLTAIALLNPITERLLELSKNNKKQLKMIRITFCFTLIMILINPWLSYSDSLLMSFSAGLANLIICLCISAYQIIKKTKHAKTVFLYQASITLALIYSILLFNGLVLSAVTMHAVLVACFFISSIVLSYLLIWHFITQRDEKTQLQHQQLAQVRAKDTLLEETIKIQDKSQEELESKIQERTFELEITLRKLEEKNRELEEKNTHDALTGIRNRHYFDKKLSMEFRRSRREQTALAILMLDIDHFKIINDTLGHLAGDEAIKFVANTIKDSLQRPSDEACRYGGEEFAVILPNPPEEGAIAVAETIRTAIESAKIHTSAGIIEMTISAGVHSSVAELNNDPNQHTAQADKALYQAKEAGRNQVSSLANSSLITDNPQ
ncbi:sensor domain-containing diguanylate cyclase [Pseudoalteromonas denitrificans]|uniref:diguanylate cyclase n=1 Tax=Pseudoalteromonas denitrificans DSM 6059 TaxID=1123010 RepID=A0A1I1ME17_9GAMM|nr:diguanylate cyclase [Pseudoalteromonas denitrificans]SFC83609.1 diguanylate cyclase (GGDEF) domain-containing protein [Pseudoalteromonas denitrificans DSM 6059]